MAAEPNTLANETKVLESAPKKEAKKEKVTAEKKTEKKVKQTRAPRARKVEELVNEATKKMTDKEKDILIKFLREDTTKLKNQIDALKANIEASYKKAQLIEEQYKDMEAFYRDSLAYIDGQVVAFANAVRKSTVGGVN